MASTTSKAFSVWPIVGYAVLAILLSYLAVRIVKHLKARRTITAALPKPVSGAAAHKKSALGLNLNFGRSTGWDWRRWSLPRVPSWPRVPEAVKGKARAVANAKNLSVELLPTTGLPPPPSTLTPMPVSMSMPTPQLVDLSTPVPMHAHAHVQPTTPPLTTGFTSTSFPNSPRTPSPAFHLNLNLGATSKALLAGPSFPRPPSPSPHTLLATTPPPKNHRRSRSLGGVPVRRLSNGGPSGLRNAVEMRDLSSSGHVRDTSREHLLIDFSSSSSDDEGVVTKVSPAASDIGVLPHGKETLPLVGVGRHMPLVDLGDDEVEVSDQPRQQYEDSWKWFEKGTSSSPGYGYGYGNNIAMDSKPRSIDRQLVSFPQPQTRTENQKLVDVDGENDAPHAELVSVSGSGSDSIHVRRAEVEQNIMRQHPHPHLVDLSHSKAGAQAPEPSFTLSDSKAGAQAPVTSFTSKEAPLVDLHDDETHVVPTPHTLVKATAAFPHPLEDLVQVSAQPDAQHLVVSVSEKEATHTPPAAAEHGLLFVDSEFGPQAEVDAESDVEAAEPPSPLIIPMADDNVDVVEHEVEVESQTQTQTQIQTQQGHQGGWAWDDVEVDDPWGNHIPMASDSLDSLSPSSPDSDVFVYTGMDAVSSPVSAPASPQRRGEEDNLIVFDAADSSADEEDEDTETFVFPSESEPLPEQEVLEKSPGGTLFATVLPDDEDELEGGGVPPLDLDLDLEGGLGLEKELALDLELEQPVEPSEAEEDEEEVAEEEDTTPKPTPASVMVELPILPVDGDEDEATGVLESVEQEQVPVPVIVIQDSTSVSGSEDKSQPESESTSETYPDPDFLPLPEPSSPSSLLMAVDEAIAIHKEVKPEDKERVITSQTPTPPASPPPNSSFRFVSGPGLGSNKSQPPSPGGGGMRSMRLLPSPRLGVVLPLPIPTASPIVPKLEKAPVIVVGHMESEENETPTALSAGGKPLWAIQDAAEAPLLLSSPGVRRRVLVDVSGGDNEETLQEKEDRENQEQEERVRQHVHELKLSSSLPGSFPDSDPASSTLTLSPPPPASISATSSPTSTSPSTTIGARLALTPNTLTRPPSARSLVRSPLDIALAMQLRPGLGAGADPAWMVRFLMAMFGWFAVAVSGGEHFR